MKNTQFGDDLITSLTQAVKIRKGRLAAKKSKDTVQVSPIKEYNPVQIKQLRKKIGMSASVFAKVLGVSTVTVQSWERGFRHPSGSSARLIQIIINEPETINKFMRAK